MASSTQNNNFLKTILIQRFVFISFMKLDDNRLQLLLTNKIVSHFKLINNFKMKSRSNIITMNKIIIIFVVEPEKSGWLEHCWLILLRPQIPNNEKSTKSTRLKSQKDYTFICM